MADRFTQSLLYGQLNNATQATERKNAKIEELCDTIDELKRRQRDTQYANWEHRCHMKALEAKCEMLMGVIDNLSGGADQSALRMPDPTTEEPARIPAGPRAGQAATYGDTIYFEAFAKEAKRAPSFLDLFKTPMEVIRRGNIFK